MRWGRLNGDTRFLQQLHGLLIHTKHRMGGIVGFFIRFEHVFHAGDKLGIGLRRDNPGLGLLLGHAIFLSVRRTVS